MKYQIVDPPGGWKYGFPKQIPQDVKDLRQWFIDNGYPEKEIELALKYSRYWYEEEE